MPNGGLTPDCVHCKHYTGKPISEGEPHCRHHKINLPVPIRAFCKNYTDTDPIDDVDWLDTELNRAELDASLMYVWLGGYEVKFFHVELTTIRDYTKWTYDKFFEELQKIQEKYNDD